jgi:hypothetical protein
VTLLFLTLRGRPFGGPRHTHALGPVLVALAVLLSAASCPGQARSDGSLLERLKLERLQQVRRDTQQLRQAADPRPMSGAFRDLRTAIHVHSRLSHDSVGTPEEILAAAKKVGIRALFMTEHPTPDRKWLAQQVRGEREGVLFIPGAETSDGLLVFRSDRIDWPPDEKTPALLEKLNAGGGMGIICHPEKRADWDLPSFAGMEIYNTHADAEDNRAAEGPVFQKGKIADALMLLSAFRQYPVEAFAAIFDPPTGNLKVWDGLNRKRHVTGIAGNDSHANVGVIAEADEKRVVLKDPLGKVIGGFNQKDVPPFLLGVGAYRPGEKVLDLRLDPYDVSLGYVSTHLLAEALTEDALFAALRHGRAYVAFDWMANPSGFTFTGRRDGQQGTMGDDLPLGARLSVSTSLAGRIRLLRDGMEVARGQGRELAADAAAPGAYRVEVSLPVAGEDRPWIYSNPIYVNGAGSTVSGR